MFYTITQYCTLMDLFFENDYIRITYRKELNAVMAVWKRQPGSKEYREGFTQNYHAVVKYKPVNYFSDVSNQGLIKPEDRAWMEQELMPKVVAEGLQNVAVVLQPDVFKEYYLERIKEAWEKGSLRMNYFDSIEKAERWLKSFV